jgi:hypothetical protein
LRLWAHARACRTDYHSRHEQIWRLSVAITGSGSCMVFREKIEIIELAGPTSDPVFSQLNPTRAAPRTMIITAGGFWKAPSKWHGCVM